MVKLKDVDVASSFCYYFFRFVVFLGEKLKSFGRVKWISHQYVTDSNPSVHFMLQKYFPACSGHEEDT